jgi:hypothetical protein
MPKNMSGQPAHPLGLAITHTTLHLALSPLVRDTISPLGFLSFTLPCLTIS